MTPKRTKSMAGMWIGGGLMIFSPLIGMLGSVDAMRHAFHALGNSGAANPEDLSRSISAVLQANVVSLAGIACGLLIFVVSVICFFVAGHRRRHAGV